MSQPKDNDSGALFANDRKETDKHPDYKGSTTVGGVEYWVSGWKRTAKNTGLKYLSLSYTPKNAGGNYGNGRQQQGQYGGQQQGYQNQGGYQQQNQGQQGGGFEDDTPF